jgi:hypothetical protein
LPSGVTAIDDGSSPTVIVLGSAWGGLLAVSMIDSVPSLKFAT